MRVLDFNLDDCTIDVSEIATIADDRTKIVAIGAAANSCGSITDVKEAVKVAKAEWTIGFSGRLTID